MFAVKPRKELEIAIRVLLVAVILLNALAINSTPVQAAQETDSASVGRQESRSIPTFPTFERPQERITGRDEHHAEAPALLSTSARGEFMPMYSVGGEGLRLENTGFNFGDGAADWIVQKSFGSSDPGSTQETLFTFSGAAVRRGDSILNNFVASLPYTVKANEAGPGYWMSFQLAGKQTSGSGLIAGTDSAKFYVDIVSPAGLPVTCDSRTGGLLTGTCVQDSVSHVHGMVDSGPVPAQGLDFNSGGGFAKFAVHGLTAGQELIVTFGSTSAINELNTLSSCWLDKCKSSASSATGVTTMPINTRTGNYEYFTEDLSIPTSAGDLSFTRDYVSAITSLSSTLGPGWTHSHDTRLIFSTDPEGLPNKVLFKAHTANKYVFYDDVNTDVYIPEPGLHAMLVKNTGTPVTYTLKDSGQEVYTFNEAGKLLTYADAQGHTWTYSYLPDGKLDQITAEGGKFLNLDYDPQGRINLVKDHHIPFRSVSFHYNANGDLDSFTDVLGQTWTYEYNDPNHNHYLTRVAAPGNVTVERQEYYANGKAWKQYDGEDKLIVELTYNADGTTSIKDALNHTETHAYDSRGTLTTDTNGAGGNLGKQYDFNFRPSVITDPLLNQTQLDWSLNGVNLKYIKDELDGETFIYYEDPDIPNSPTKITDPMGYETTYSYTNTDFLTLPTQIEYPLLFPGDTTNIHTDYDYYPPSSGIFAGRIMQVTDPLLHTTFYEYQQTATGHKEIVHKAYQTESEQITEYEYDDLGRLIKVTDPSGIVMTHEYDNAGRLTKTIRNVHPTITTQNYQEKYNIVTEFRYDLRGNQIAVIDTYGTITRTYYDLDNRPVTVVQNLVGQTIETTTPPAAGTGVTGENIRMDTIYDDAGNVIATVDAAGFTTRTYYDSANRPNLTIQHFVGAGTYDPAYPDQNIRTEYYYDSNGNVIATRDTLGVITRTYYDELNRPKAVIQNLFINGTVNDINTPLASVPAYTSTNPDRNLRTDTYYDANGNVIATKDPKGIWSRTYYDSLNRPVAAVQNLVGKSYTDPTLPDPGAGGCGSAENICTFTYYDKAGNAIATVDPRGVVTRTYYDSANRPIATVQNWVGSDIYSNTIPARGSGGPDENVRTDIAYDSSGRRDTTTDPLGHITKYQYNEVGQLFKITGNYINNGVPQNDGNQRNIVTTFEYDALGRQVKTTDTLGRIALTTYDDLSRVLTTTQNSLQGQPQNYKNTTTGDQYNLKTTFTYDSRSNQIAVTDTKNVVTRTYYDALGRSVTIVQNFTGVITNTTPPERGNPVDPLANLRTDTVYLGNSSVDYVLDELGKKTDYSYDALGRLTSVLDPLLNPTNYGYDANSNRTLMTTFKTAEEPTSTKYGYDDLNRLNEVFENFRFGIAPDFVTNVKTTYTYDAGGNRLSIRDGNSNLPNEMDYRTTFSYDDLGRLKTETDALGHTTTYDYLADYVLKKNRVVLTDANLKVTTSHYDELDRLAQIDYPSPDADVTFTYDALGRRLTLADGLGTSAWNYTNIDQPKLITDPFGTGVSYDYDPLGNRTALSYGSQSYTYQYNNLNQLDAVTGSGLPNPVTYQYDPAGRLKNVTRPNGANTVYNYFDNGWLQNITHASGTTTLASYQYQYYDNGNRSQAVENVSLPSQPPTATPTTIPTATATPTLTYTPSNTPTITLTPSRTPTPTQTFTATNTPTNTNTATTTLTPSKTPTPSQTPTSGPTSTATQTPSNTPVPGTATPTSAPSGALYLSLDTGGTVAGVTAQDVDIIYFDGTSWSMFFDASDVGVPNTGMDLNDFYIVDADTILLVFDAPLTLGALAVDPWDIVQFDATSLGDVTAGMFSLYFDGNDVGFDSTSEYIDGLDVLPDGHVLISTTGGPSVPGVAGQDEDILAFTPTTLGDVTSGSWAMYFDGSDVGLADASAEDMDALDVASNGDIRVSTLGDFAVTGVSGFDEDVFVCAPTSLGDATACNYSSSLFFDGSVWGLDANDVDGLNLPLGGSAFKSNSALAFGAAYIPAAYRFAPLQQSGSLTFTPIDDAYIESASPTVNHGSATTLQVDNSPVLHFLLKFDVTGVSGQTITSAKIRLYNTNSSTKGGDFYHVGVDTWQEETVTWNNAPAADTTLLASLGSVSPDTWYEVDITSLITGDGTYSLRVSSTSTNGADYSSKEGANPPQLVITLGTSTATPTPTATATQPPTATPTVTATQTPAQSATFTPTFTPTPIPSGPITIDYVYDPLNRLTEANYSNNDYYHYTYDAVGNRETQGKSVLGFVTNDTYVYDDANRLTSVNGVNYSWDNNGNLLNDGVSTYTYDSANRLKSLTQGGNTYTFAYNGLGDRFSQNGIHYTLDLNAGLTQVLHDGTNAYVYGIGRIAQVDATTEYFMGDALGSVRQLTNASGAITYAKAYDPYGVVTSIAGSAQSAYGYTGEFTSNNLVYLRARMYAPGIGRFLTQDTWDGDENTPMSYNLGNYVQSNPVNYTDPSGHDKCLSGEYDYEGRADFAEKYVPRVNVNLLNTYTAGGIGVQCYSIDKPWHDPYQGVGIAQVTDRQVEEAYGDKVLHLDEERNPDEFENGKPVVRGYGLRCWIRIADGCTICKSRDELNSAIQNGQNFDDVYRLEEIHNQATETDWAVEYMRRRIEQVINNCVNCTDTDRFIAAALGQNGSGLHPGAMRELSVANPNNLFRTKSYLPIDWEKYFTVRIQNNPNTGDYDTRKQLELFYGVVTELHRRSPTGWYIPSRLNKKLIKKLIEINP